MSRTLRLTSAVALTAASLGLIGCASSSGEYSYSKIAGNITPEMSTLDERSIDIDRNVALTNNINLRMFTNDWGRVFYTNQPSRLSPYPIAGSSGQPF